MMQDLRRDRFLQASVAGFSLFTIAHTALRGPWLERLVAWTDPVLLALLVAATVRAMRAAPTLPERRFWRLFIGTFSTWALITAINLFTPDPYISDPRLSVVMDGLFVISYLFVLFAIETRPHQVPPEGHRTWTSAYEWGGGAILAVGLMAYYVVIPSNLDPKSYATYVSSMTLFVLFDVALALLLARRLRRLSDVRWRAVYGCLGLAFLLTLTTDSAELLAYIRNGDLEVGAVWDLTWAAQFTAFTVAAVLASRLSPGAPLESPAGSSTARSLGLLVPFTFVMPAIDLARRLAGMENPVIDGYRETVALVCMLALGSLTVVAHLREERRHRRVRHELQHVQAELQQSRKMQALGRLAGGVAHDYNNLLSVIIGYTEILLERRAPGDRNQEPLEQIKQAAERAVTLTRQLMTFSQRQQVEQALFELDRALAAREPLLARLAGAANRLRIQPAAAAGWVLGDIQQFERVLINLVANARDAMPDGGAIDIQTRWRSIDEEGSREQGSLPAGRYLELSVADSGVGMTDEAMAHLFEPFFTTKERGQHRGLGLAVVYGIVMEAGGHIDLSSEPGHGTTVRILFPAQPVPAAEAALDPVIVSPPDDVTVLIAEDERGLRRLMRACLERAGYQVLEASDGRAAFDMAAQHDGRIDLLLTDVIMPGMNGRELAERLEHERPEMRVLFVSGYTADVLRDLRLPNAGVAFLQKPFSLDALLQRVRGVLDATSDLPGLVEP